MAEDEIRARSERAALPGHRTRPGERRSRTAGGGGMPSSPAMSMSYDAAADRDAAAGRPSTFVESGSDRSNIRTDSVGTLIPHATKSSRRAGKSHARRGSSSARSGDGEAEDRREWRPPRVPTPDRFPPRLRGRLGARAPPGG